MKHKHSNGVAEIAAPSFDQLSRVNEVGPGPAESSKNTLIKNGAAVETWAVSLQEIYDNCDLRLDASHYDRQTAETLKQLSKSPHPLRALSAMATINLPNHFVRIWAKDSEHGIPYVNATDLMGLTGIGTISGSARYLSRQTETDINALIIREGWLLMTCSGTIGRIFYVPQRLDGWVATHDLIRIIPNEDVPVGFLHAYLSSPVAQQQIAGYTHGGQIDHVTHHQIGGVLVPDMPQEKMRAIHRRTMVAFELREKAIAALAEIAEDVKA